MSKVGESQDRNIIAGAGVIAALLVAFRMYQRRGALFDFYYFQFDWIWCILSGLAAGFVFLLSILLFRASRHIRGRHNKLTKFSESKDSVFVGMASDNTKVFIPQQARFGHVQILGSTGRGKTESTILPWLLRDLRNRNCAIMIDGKGDRELLGRIRKGAAGSGEVRVFDMDQIAESCTINPLASGSPQQVSDRLITAFTFEEPFYKAVSYEVLGLLTRLVQEPGEQVTFKLLHELLTDDQALADRVGRSTNTPLQGQLARFLSEPRRERDQKLKGLVSQLSPFAIGELAPVVNGPQEGLRDYVNVSDYVLNAKFGSAFVLLLPTLKYQNLAAQLGKILLQEIGWAVNARQNHPYKPPVSVFLDEFGGFVYQGFENVLNKARSSRVALHLSHQTVGDLSIVSPQLAEIINTNTNVKCLFGLNDPFTAEYFAKYLGTHTHEKKTERVEKSLWLGGEEKTGDASIRETEAFNIHPNILKSLTAGRGVLHFQTERDSFSEVIQFSMATAEELGSR